LDPVVARNIQNFGYSHIIVTVDQGLAAGVPDPKIIENNFLSEAPMGTLALGTETKQPPFRYYPNLTVYSGYMDQSGVDNTEAAGFAVYASEYLSAIRPIEVKSGLANEQLTWGLKLLNIRDLWDRGIKGKGIRVGHLDSGVDATHEALRGRIKDFIETDLDGNIVNDNRSVSEKAHDSGMHGTHTAGSLCGGEVDGMSVGVAPDCEVFSALVIEGGKAMDRVLSGLDWCVKSQVRVLNMSLGFRGYTPFFEKVISTLRQKGILPVIAIGNEGPGTSRSPGNYPEVLSVGMIDSQRHVDPLSSSIIFNRPQEPYQPDVVAPGVEVLSTKTGGGILSMTGSSMATPHVAGVAALLFCAEPTATVDQVEKAIVTTCKPVPQEDKSSTGFGVIDPKDALEELSKLIR
jgi:subtilisin family serine protease